MAKKVKIVEPTTPKTLEFKISNVIEYEGGLPYKKVYLGGKIIYKIDTTILAGMAMRDQTKDVIAAISKAIGRPVSKEEFNRIRLFNLVELTPPTEI